MEPLETQLKAAVTLIFALAAFICKPAITVSLASLKGNYILLASREEKEGISTHIC